jgi:MOSC domain-containing protein YiiM
MPSTITSVSLSPEHSFSKDVKPEIALIAGLGVEGDAHAGVTVRHRYRVRKDPTAPNLCQVHLIHEELFAELAEQGIDVTAGTMGENVTTRGIDLLALPRGTRLALGDSAVVEVTGLREPCEQMNGLRPGLMKACLSRSQTGELVRKAGIMAIVISSGTIRPGDCIVVHLPDGPTLPLYPV